MQKGILGKGLKKKFYTDPLRSHIEIDIDVGSSAVATRYKTFHTFDIYFPASMDPYTQPIEKALNSTRFCMIRRLLRQIRGRAKRQIVDISFMFTSRLVYSAVFQSR